ncbi:MAG: hypothetical protein VKL39_07090, partial [Leptolyngbyaceae bacterium]|nr:hypothetical protein [Leptolyngbyaceae bacterium]
MGLRNEARALSIIDTWRATGRNVSETGRLHFPDRTENNQRRDVRRALDWGVQKGEILPGEYDPTPTPSA